MFYLTLQAIAKSVASEQSNRMQFGKVVSTMLCCSLATQYLTFAADGHGEVPRFVCWITYQVMLQALPLFSSTLFKMLM